MIAILILILAISLIMAIDGVRGPTKRVGKHNLEVRTDGFGTNTDKWVEDYKKHRPKTYLKDVLDNYAERIAAIEEYIEVLQSPE